MGVVGTWSGSTSNERARDRRFRTPIEPQAWTLSLTGTVDRTHELSLDELRSFDLRPYTADFECVEGWGGEDLSWRGVPMGELLARAEPQSATQYGLVRAADGEYACTFPLARLADLLLAVELDDEPLPIDHGGPARLVPTGSEPDCWESIKWVTEIEVRETEPVESDTAQNIALARIE